MTPPATEHELAILLNINADNLVSLANDLCYLRAPPLNALAAVLRQVAGAMEAWADYLNAKEGE